MNFRSSSTAVISGCLISVFGGCASAGDEGPFEIARYANMLAPTDIVRLLKSTNGRTGEKNVEIHPSGSDVIGVVEQCASRDYPICIDFGEWFRLSLPCDPDSLGQEWEVDDWRFEYLAGFGEREQEHTALIRASLRGRAAIHVLYSYNYGIRQFAFVEKASEQDEMGDFEIQHSHAVYVLQRGAYGEEASFCD